MATLFPLPSATGNKKHSAEKPKFTHSTRCSYRLVTLIGLDILGVLLMLIGLHQQFHHHGFLSESLDTPYVGVMLLTAGVVLTLPFFIWSFKANFRPLDNVNASNGRE
ncbi:hypothetical protein FX988_04069 [Paraglaciecola mesophila]|uniref:Uncharacterized protein n=2 Tax=Paraglaciecola mesophila TaxID=197222 RepID=A0A857JNZ8_9ALTE|nr:hypothetical protein FX988_04069 [Paraglaciecola mesophila]